MWQTLRLKVGGLVVLMVAACSPFWPTPDADQLRFVTHWERLQEHFISADGRVIDLNSERSISTSEGQAYGMFFALVANDQAQFDTLLNWTLNNLVPERSFANPPAWLWGQRDDGSWGVLDSNAAADADVWMAYALFSAAEHWQQPSYAEHGKALANQVLRTQTYDAKDGLVLLPGPQGFEHTHGVTVNPSYFSQPLFPALARYTNDRRWNEIYRTSQAILTGLQTLQGIPDWVDVNAELELSKIQTRELEGSYNAIRTYLWLAQDAKRTEQRVAPQLQDLVKQLLVAEKAPETIRLNGEQTPQFIRSAPIGFYAMYAPYLAAIGEHERAQLWWDHIATWPEEDYRERYYDTMLLLFGLGYQQCYLFDPDGELVLNNQADWCYG